MRIAATTKARPAPPRSRWGQGEGALAFMLAVALVVALAAAAAPHARAQSGATGAFARIGFGPRGIGAGNALVASRSASPYYNPAFAPLAEEQALSASAALLSLDRQLQYLQFAIPLKPRAGVTFGLTHAGVSGIDGRDDSGYRTEVLSTDEYQVFAAFGLRFSERVSGGLAAKFYRADYGLIDVDPVSAVGFDLGLSVQATERLALGLALGDLLARYEWDTAGQYENQAGRLTEDALPVRLRLGGAYALFEGKARLSAEYEARFAAREERTATTRTTADGTEIPVTAEEEVRRRTSLLRLGATYQPVGLLTLRVGLDRLASETLARPSAGFTVRQDIGQLPVAGSYSAAFERGVGSTMHVFGLRIVL